MMRNKSAFSKESKFNGNLKSFIIAFLLFIIILSLSSVVLFMYSLDFDINNFVEKTAIKNEDIFSKNQDDIYSVQQLTGNSNIMFVLLDNNGDVASLFCTMVDFNNQMFKVRQINGDSTFLYNKESRVIDNIYKNYDCEGLKKSIFENWNIYVEKHVVFNYNELKNFLSSFNGITVKVFEDVSYKSSEYNLELNKGEQELSGEKTLNYLLVCENSAKESVICDIISSVLKPEYVDNAYALFKEFVNSSKTNISVIDYSESIEPLKIYCYAEDRFDVIPYYNGESK